MEMFGLIAIGVVAGTLSGFLGVGGATILIPALLVLFKMTQHMAQGTSLAALLLPVGILAVMKYHSAGNVNFKFAAFLAAGFVIGGLFGSIFAHEVQGDLLRKLFGLYLIVIALQMIFFK